MTADPHMDGCTVGFDRPRLHHSREGINPIYVGMLAHLCTPGLLLVGVEARRGIGLMLFITIVIKRAIAFFDDRDKTRP
jgi:hypothetical protein